MMDPIKSLRRLWANSDRAVNLLGEIRDSNARIAAAIEQGKIGHGHFAASAPGETQPIRPIDFVELDLDQPDPISPLREDSTFQACVAFFRESPSARRALVSPDTQAILHCLIRTLRPALVVEIGSFRASTTEALARAVQANRFGLVHTIDPFGASTIPPILAAWPEPLRRSVRFFPDNSMTYFANLAQQQERAGLIFIDGNHDYEFALFDIVSAARFIDPGGVVAVDNISQPGPLLALRDFLASAPGWRQIGGSQTEGNIRLPFDRHRTRIHNTDLALLRAPKSISIRERPFSYGQESFAGASINGVTIHLAEAAQGELVVQAVLRNFRPVLKETAIDVSISLSGQMDRLDVAFAAPESVTPDAANTIEIWLLWRGEKPLEMIAAPTAY